MGKSFAPLVTVMLVSSMLFSGGEANISGEDVATHEQLPDPVAPKLLSFTEVIVRSVTVYPYMSPVTLTAKTRFDSITLDLGEGRTFTYNNVDGYLEVACGKIKLYFDDEQIKPVTLDEVQSREFIEAAGLGSIAGIMPVCEVSEQ